MERTHRGSSPRPSRQRLLCGRSRLWLTHTWRICGPEPRSPAPSGGSEEWGLVFVATGVLTDFASVLFIMQCIVLTVKHLGACD
eukprot:5482526-Amphidinium_carterae.1